jgi:MFS family permease
LDLKKTNSRRTFFGISSFQALAMFRRGLFYNYLSIYLRHFLGLSVTETTLFATLPMIANVVFQTFVWGSISDRFQLRRTLIVWGELLAGVGTVFIWYAHRLTDSQTWAGYIIIIGLTVVEIFWSMSNVGWSALISDIYKEENRGKVQGQLASIGGLGRIIGVWIGGLMYDGLSMKYMGWGFYEGALFFIAAAVMALSIIPMYYVPEGGIDYLLKNEPNHTNPVKENDYIRTYVIFIIGLAFLNFGKNSVAVIQTQYLVLESGFNVTSRVLSYIVNTQSLAMVLVGLVAGWIDRRLGSKYALLLGSFTAIMYLIILGVSINLKMIVLSNFIAGFSEVIIMVSSYSFVSILIPPEKRGKLFAIFNATYFLSWGLAGTFIAGPIIDWLIIIGKPEVFSYQMSFIAAAGITFIGLVVLGYLTFSNAEKKLGKTNETDK